MSHTAAAHPHTTSEPAPASATARRDLSPARSTAGRLLAFVRRDLIRQLRMVESVFFIAVLPTALFVMFTSMSSSGGQSPADAPAGEGNVVAYLMVSIALYGAVTATTSIAGSASVERQLGWGRQLSLTALTGGQYMLGKTLVALGIAVLPVVLVFGAGVAMGAEFSDLWRWAASAGLVLLGAMPFALFGLAAALVFRSEAAVSAASGMLVVFSFLGNLFIPLSGTLLEIARFTPLYGSGVLARWPLLEGSLATMEGEMQSDSLGTVLLCVGAWTALFALVCLIAARRRTSRS